MESIDTEHLCQQRKKEEIDRKIKDLIIQGLQSLSFVEDESFIDLIQTCEPRYTVSARSTDVT